MSTILSKPKINHKSEEKESKALNDLDEEVNNLLMKPNSPNYNEIILDKSLISSIEQIIKNIRHQYESGLVINNLEKNDMLIGIEDFEIYDKRANPIFLRNLLNMINVINLVWLKTNKDVPAFHIILKNYFNTKFSYLDDESTDFILAMPLQKAALMKVYEMKNAFPDISESSIRVDNLYLDLNRIKSYTLQEMSLSAIFAKVDANNYIVLPNIIFYIRQNSVINKFRYIFQYPKDIKFQKLNREKEFLGFNELDYVIKVKSKGVLIEPTNMINYAKLGNNINYLNDKIIFNPNTVHLFEFKSNGYNANKEIPNLLKSSKRFMNVFKNNVVSNYNFYEINDNYKCHYVYDENRDSIKSSLLENENTETSLIYSSPGNSISLLVTIQNKIQNEISDLKNEICDLKNEMSDLKNEIYNLNSKFNNFHDNIFNLFNDSINPKLSFRKYSNNLTKEKIDFEKELSETEKLEKSYLTFKYMSEKQKEDNKRFWIEFFQLFFKKYLDQIGTLEKKINNFFLLKDNIGALSTISNCLGKSVFEKNEVDKLKNLFSNVDIKNYNDMLYFSLKYIFFQINNENTLLDCFSDKNDIKIHDMILNLFKYGKYQREKDLSEKEFTIVQVAILKEIIDIAKLNDQFSELCLGLLFSKPCLKQFIIGCILLINSENDNAMELINNLLNYYDY